MSDDVVSLLCYCSEMREQCMQTETQHAQITSVAVLVSALAIVF